MEIRAEERGLAGRSFVRNIFGQSSLANWEFIGRITGDPLIQSIDGYAVSFQLTYGASIESLAGLDQKEAQKALKEMHNMVVSDGWHQITSNPPWYSHRYIMDIDTFEKHEKLAPSGEYITKVKAPEKTPGRKVKIGILSIVGILVLYFFAPTWLATVGVGVLLVLAIAIQVVSKRRSPGQY